MYIAMRMICEETEHIFVGEFPSPKASKTDSFPILGRRHGYRMIDPHDQPILIISWKHEANGQVWGKYESVMPQVPDLLDVNWNGMLPKEM